MGKLKDKLIRLMGGYTEEDILVRTRPVRCAVTRFNIRTLKCCRIVRDDMVEVVPESIEYAKKDLAYMLADKMIEENLIEFHSEHETHNETKITAIAKIVMPTEASE